MLSIKDQIAVVKGAMKGAVEGALLARRIGTYKVVAGTNRNGDPSALIAAVKGALSASRIGTYEVAAGTSGGGDPSALNLYFWNAHISSALHVALHICEVVVRNAVAEALELKYGPGWAWSPAFERSLPDPSGKYSPRRDLHQARHKATTVGKVIPELKLAFWQHMFTRRHDRRLWNPYLLRVMPGLDASKSVSLLREGIYEDLKEIRTLRNRIAHYEPILEHDLADDFTRITRLIAYRSQVMADLMISQCESQVREMIKKRPTARPSLFSLRRILSGIQAVILFLCQKLAILGCRG